MKTKIFFLIAVFFFSSKFIFAQTPTYTLRVDSMRLVDVPPYEDNAIEFGVYLTHTNAAPFGYSGMQLMFSFNPEIVSGNPFDTGNVLKYLKIGSQLFEPYQPRNPTISTAINPSATIMRMAINSAQWPIDLTGVTDLLVVRMRLWSRAGPFNPTHLSMAFRNPPIVTFATRLFAIVNDNMTDITTPETHTIDSSGLPGVSPVEPSGLGIPTVYHISQNYPNPFNPSTKLDYDLPEYGKVSLIVYDISGREVVRLLDEFKTAGYYTVQFNAAALSSGIYFYRMSVNDFIVTKRMMMVK